MTTASEQTAWRDQIGIQRDERMTRAELEMVGRQPPEFYKMLIADVEIVVNASKRVFRR